MYKRAYVIQKTDLIERYKSLEEMTKNKTLLKIGFAENLFLVCRYYI